jgi:hypothetical protein
LVIEINVSSYEERCLSMDLLKNSPRTATSRKSEACVGT